MSNIGKLQNLTPSFLNGRYCALVSEQLGLFPNSPSTYTVRLLEDTPVVGWKAGLLLDVSAEQVHWISDDLQFQQTFPLQPLTTR